MEWRLGRVWSSTVVQRRLRRLPVKKKKTTLVQSGHGMTRVKASDSKEIMLVWVQAVPPPIQLTRVRTGPSIVSPRRILYTREHLYWQKDNSCWTRYWINTTIWFGRNSTSKIL
ncbi:hypothetical protein PISMIDRAFT_504945 [Pisolithus microcarpus 441]|uniref:Uncharacterized protein n=1 Tax=Pisolithus microcarpus 441 TaxID=765257 RepID=A0A0C9Z8F7_9AGAM|nr:hypothetical protein PISMIDRAFT_504945 [Pisolithus microcarpus 441]